MELVLDVVLKLAVCCRYVTNLSFHTHTHPHTRIRLSKSMHSGIDSKGITHMISKAHRLGENSSLYIPLLGEKLYRE